MSDTRIIFQGNRLWHPTGPDLEVQVEAGLRLPEGVLVQRVAEAHPLPEGVEALGLRDAFARMTPEAWVLAGRAYQWLVWAEGHRFCGACASPMEAGEGQGRRCPSCGSAVFPSNSTARSEEHTSE